MKNLRNLLEKILKAGSLTLLTAVSILLHSCQGNDSPSHESTGENLVSETFSVVENTILNRRSIRRYTSQDIDSVTLRKILHCGIHAPNGKGMESWQIRIVRKGQLMNKINQAQSTLTGVPATEATFNAPVLIFIAYDKNYDLSQVDCGMLGQNIQLAAYASGLGTCCLGGICRTLRMPQNAHILKQLEIPDTHQLLYAIALGYPDQQPSVKERHWDRIKEIR